MSNFIQKIKSNRAGHVIAVFFAIAGPIMFMLTVNMVAGTGSYNVAGAGMGIMFTLMAPIFALFPGGERRIIDYPDQNVKLSILWAESSSIDKIAWIMGIAASLYFYQDLENWIGFFVAWWK